MRVTLVSTLVSTTAILYPTLVLSLQLIESKALNLCSDSLSLTAAHFNVLFTPHNQSMSLSLDGSSSISGKVIAEMVLTVYGYEALRKALDPCDMGLDGLCPVKPGPLPTMSTNIKIPENVVKQIPSIAYTVPDLDASVRVYINSTATGKTITCIEAALSNGKTVYQAGVGWTTAVISGLGLVASAITSSLGNSKTGTHITSSIVSLFGFMQAQAMFGMSSVHLPPIVQSWTQNFQWSMGIIHVRFLDKLCTWYQRATGGTPSTMLTKLSTTSVHVLKRASLKKVGDAANSAKSGTVVVRGIQRVGFRAGIEDTNIFLTGLIFLIVFVVLMMLFVALFKVACEFLAKSGRKVSFKAFPEERKFVAKGIMFRLFLIGYPQMAILCLWEFTRHDSPAEVLLAVAVFLSMTFTIGFASYKVIRLAQKSLTYNQNPAYLLYSTSECLSKWGFLYVHYKATAYYFIVPTLVYLLFRAIFISSTQSAPVVQTIALLVIQISMLIVACICRPWMNRKTNIYNISITVVNFANSIFLLFFSDIFDQPGIVTGVMGVVFFVYNTAFILVLLIMLVIDSLYAIISKNPDTRYQPMQDDRESFVRPQSQLLTTELNALGATARGDMQTLSKSSDSNYDEPLVRKASSGINLSSSDSTIQKPLSHGDLSVSVPLIPSTHEQDPRRPSPAPFS